MKIAQFAKFANNATNQILGVTGLQLENLQSMFSYPNAINVTDPKLVSGDIIFIDDGAPINAKRVRVYIQTFQSGSGDPSPSNIRAISGWDNIIINHRKRNLFNKHSITENSWIRANTTIIEPQQNYFVSDYIPVKKGNVITCTKRGASRCIYYDVYKNPISYFSWNDGTLNPLYDGFVRVTDLNINLDTLQIEVGLTKTDYENFEGHNYSIDFSPEIGTVYGGVLDVVEGVLIINKKAVNLGTLTYTRQKITDEIYIFSGDIANLGAKPLSENGCCSIYTLITGNRVSGGNNRIGINTYGTRLFVRDDRYTDANTFKQAINDQILVYELNEPIVYNIDPIDILMFDGINTIIANCGSMELEYYRQESGVKPYV